MNTDRKRLVPARSDDFEICDRSNITDAKFKVLVVLISEAKPGGGVLLKAKSVFWFVSKSHRFNFRRNCSKCRKVGRAPGIDQGNAFRVCCRQQIIGNAPANHSERIGMGFAALVSKVNQKPCRNERQKDQCARGSHDVKHFRQKARGRKGFRRLRCTPGVQRTQAS